MAESVEAVGYLNFKRDSKKRVWYAMEGGWQMQSNANAMNLGRGIVDSVGLLLIGTI